MKSIKTKITTLVLCCLLISVLAIGSIGILSTKNVISKDSSQIMNLLCNEKASTLNALFSEVELSTNTLKTYALSQLESIERLQKDSAYAKSYAQSLVKVATNTAMNTEGAMAVYIRFNPEFTTPTSGIFYSKDEEKNAFVYQQPTDLSIYDASEKEYVGWYYIPVNNKQGTWISPYFNKNLNVEMISYVIPFYQDDVLVGVVGMDIDFNVLIDIVEETKVYESGYAFLVDTNANIVYHNELKNGTSLVDYNTGEFKDFAIALQQEKDSSTLFSYKYNGEKRSAAFKNLNNDMKFVLTAPISQIDERANTLIIQILIWLVLIIVISTIISIIITKKLIKPLLELNIAAQEIADGNLDVSLSYNSKDEIGTLSESFRKTAKNLKKQIEYINELAYCDLLTGVKNRTSYFDRIQKIDEFIQEKDYSFAVIVFDVNGLKHVNDTLGHDHGDMLIVNAAKLMQKVFEDNVVYRIGGDEFVVILENMDNNEYELLLDHFDRALQHFNEQRSHTIPLKIARGLTIYTANIDHSYIDVFKKADSAMHENKNQSKK